MGVNALASTPYNVAVGGTDFGDTYQKAQASYWNSTNGSTYGSAKSYIPEIHWNETYASVLVAKPRGENTTYGANGFCSHDNNLLQEHGSSAGGGPSRCATG